MAIDTVNIKITRVEKSKIESVDFNDLPFGKFFSDHMFEMDFVDGKWQEPTIVPFANLSLFLKPF